MIPAPTEARYLSGLAETTAYCDRGTTAIGTLARPGVVAVDPRWIRLGTVLRLDRFPGMSFKAEDTGKLVRDYTNIRGQHIYRLDIWVSDCTQALKWGRRLIAVTFRK